MTSKLDNGGLGLVYTLLYSNLVVDVELKVITVVHPPVPGRHRTAAHESFADRSYFTVVLAYGREIILRFCHSFIYL
jgi:hypothetical protein